MFYLLWWVNVIMFDLYTQEDLLLVQPLVVHQWETPLKQVMLLYTVYAVIKSLFFQVFCFVLLYILCACMYLVQTW
jgi:hypothetical protein